MFFWYNLCMTSTQINQGHYTVYQPYMLLNIENSYKSDIPKSLMIQAFLLVIRLSESFRTGSVSADLRVFLEMIQDKNNRGQGKQNDRDRQVQGFFQQEEKDQDKDHSSAASHCLEAFSPDDSSDQVLLCIAGDTVDGQDIGRDGIHRCGKGIDQTVVDGSPDIGEQDQSQCTGRGQDTAHTVETVSVPVVHLSDDQGMGQNGNQGKQSQKLAVQGTIASGSIVDQQSCQSDRHGIPDPQKQVGYCYISPVSVFQTEFVFQSEIRGIL